MSLNLANKLRPLTSNNQPLKLLVARMSGGSGSGAGKGGGSGGSIREAGGAMGKREAAQEEQYFRKQQAEQLSKLRQQVDGQIAAHKKLIAESEKAIAQAKKDLEELEKKHK